MRADRASGEKMGIRSEYNILDVNLSCLLAPQNTHKSAPFDWYHPSILLHRSNRVVSVAVKTAPVKKINHAHNGNRNIQMVINPGFIEINGVSEKRQITVVEFIESANKSYTEILGIYDLEITSLKAGRSVVAISGDRICDSVIVDVRSDKKSSPKNKIKPKEALCCP